MTEAAALWASSGSTAAEVCVPTTGAALRGERLPVDDLTGSSIQTDVSRVLPTAIADRKSPYGGSRGMGLPTLEPQEAALPAHGVREDRSALRKDSRESLRTVEDPIGGRDWLPTQGAFSMVNHCNSD
jgi:hypothetical protein